MKTKFNIGTTYKTTRKHPRICTVIDVLSTYNSAGEMVRVRYVATHELSGQTVTDHNVPGTSIARGLIKAA